MAVRKVTKFSFFLVQSLTLVLSLSVTSTNGINCPLHCRCSWEVDSFVVNCSHHALTDYPNFDDMPIEQLDLSNNNFVEFPKHLDMSSLIYLDLSNNLIEYLDSDALYNLVSLRTLLLDNNSFTDWTNLNPFETFRDATSLTRLSLSGNQLLSFTDDMPTQILYSESLKWLELRNCGITEVRGSVLIDGLPNLDHLVLSSNPLVNIDNLPSYSLRELELSNCSLQKVSTEMLESLPNIEVLNLSWNSALQFGTSSSTTDIVSSSTLKRLDLSFCIIDDLNLSGLPNLAAVILRGNMLRVITTQTFADNIQLEMIDLSRNALRLLEGEAFTKLKRLVKLDLSYNEISRLERNLFRSNDLLISVNLSRNVIEKFTKLVSNSLREISLSWCEILTIDTSAFTGLSAIQRLDMSNNLIREFPGGMRSETLQTLDLSNCRLSSIRNTTFRDFPELAALQLSGNRFTTPFSSKYFQSNKYLDEIWLGDNPWICNCADETFLDFYDFLTAAPRKLKDGSQVHCASPSKYYGKTWEGACLSVWKPNARATSGEKVWTTILLLLVVLCGVAFLYTCFQKYIRHRIKQYNNRQYRENQEELNEIRRQNQRMLRQDGTPNAPGAIEMNLPSYEDAILMPKLERSSKSMVDLTASNRSRKKLIRAQTNPEEEEEVEGEDGLRLDNAHRFRSEEMLSNRFKERTALIMPYRRTGHMEYNNSGSRLCNFEDSRFPAAHLKSQNLQSAEQIGNFQSYTNSPYTKRKPKVAEIPPFKRASLRADSVEFLTDPEFDAQSKPSSPFARRKPKAVEEISKDEMYENIQQHTSAIVELAPAIEDYFGTTQKSQEASLDGSDFQIVIEPEVTSLSDKNCSSSTDSEIKADRVGMRKKLKNPSSRRASGNFSAAAAAAGACSSSSSIDKDPIVIVHKPMRETLF